MLPMGYRLRFFVGMAHIKPLESNRISVSFSQVEIKANITNSYVFSTQTSTDFTFIRDVSVQLREVKHDGSSNTTKFATHGGCRIHQGALAHDACIPMHPNIQPLYYSGLKKSAIDTLLTAQSRCALQDPLCSAQGPVPVGPGGSIQFTFPLEDSAWTPEMLANTNQFVSSLYIDFMIAVFDKEGNKLMTTMQTTTPLRTTGIVSMCTELLASASVEEVLSVDMFLFLVG